MDIAILLYDGFTALDAIGPYEVLSCLPDVTVHFIAETVGPKRTDTQALALVADASLAEFPIQISSLFLVEVLATWPLPIMSRLWPGYERRIRPRAGAPLSVRAHSSLVPQAY